jgi:hypothetical protein
MAFEDVACSAHRKDEPPRRNATDLDDLELLVKAHDEDRESHPERVNRCGVGEEDRLGWSELGTPRQSATAFGIRLRDTASKLDPAPGYDLRLAHDRTVSLRTDVQVRSLDQW